jgi:hypothetical protein
MRGEALLFVCKNIELKAATSLMRKKHKSGIVNLF